MVLFARVTHRGPVSWGLLLGDLYFSITNMCYPFDKENKTKQNSTCDMKKVGSPPKAFPMQLVGL